MTLLAGLLVKSASLPTYNIETLLMIKQAFLSANHLAVPVQDELMLGKFDFFIYTYDIQLKIT